jgi:hypothetical protein
MMSRQGRLKSDRQIKLLVGTNKNASAPRSATLVHNCNVLISNLARAIAYTLVLSLKMVEWRVIVGCDPTITLHFYPSDGRNA